MAAIDPRVPRVRQAVLAARDLGAAAGRLQDELALGEPFGDPGVEYFGLRNAVFALGDTFLEVVSPIREDTAAGRLLDRRGGDCGYMIMFQVEDAAAARDRARGLGVRAVFEVDLEDMQEAHLHPADVRGAIVSLSTPVPPDSWRWGGPDWPRRSIPGGIVGVTVAVADPEAISTRWRTIVGSLPGVRFLADPAERGLVEIALRGDGESREPFVVAGVRFVFVQDEERDL